MKGDLSMQPIWYWVIGGVVGLVIISLVVAIVLLALPFRDNTNNLASSGCCAGSYTDADGNDVSVCGYQPFKDNPDSTGNASVSTTLTNARSFASACDAAGGSASLTSAGGVSCLCTCENPSSAMSSFVMANGEYVSSAAISGDAVSRSTTCPGYRT